MEQISDFWWHCTHHLQITTMHTNFNWCLLSKYVNNTGYKGIDWITDVLNNSWDSARIFCWSYGRPNRIFIAASSHVAYFSRVTSSSWKCRCPRQSLQEKGKIIPAIQLRAMRVFSDDLTCTNMIEIIPMAWLQQLKR